MSGHQGGACYPGTTSDVCVRTDLGIVADFDSFPNLCVVPDTSQVFEDGFIADDDSGSELDISAKFDTSGDLRLPAD